MDPELREGIEGREMELFIIEETAEFDDEEVQYTTPILLDGKTGERITIDNFDGDDDDDDESVAESTSEPEKAAATDGGAKAASTSDDSATESTETTESPDNTEAADEATSVSDEAESDDTESNADDFEEIDDLIDYFARTDGEVEPDELREFAEDEVDDLDSIDWEAAAAEVERRA
jgi:hypothetical protein